MTPNRVPPKKQQNKPMGISHVLLACWWLCCGVGSVYAGGLIGRAWWVLVTLLGLLGVVASIAAINSVVF